MTKKSLYFFICFILQGTVAAQTYALDIHVGVASIDAVNLSSLQNYIIDNSNLPLKPTESFPAQPQLSLSILKKNNDLNNIGLHWLYSSTGGRVAVSDYSGGVASDQIVNTHQIGFSTELYLKKTDLFQPYIDIQLSALLTKLQLKDSAWITDGERVSNSTTFVAQNAGFQPSIGFKFDQLPVILKLEFGYLIQVTQFPFHLKENRDATLQIFEGNKVGPGLSGIRFGIGTEFSF